MTDREGRPSLARALAITLLVPIAYLLARNLPAPGLDDALLRSMGTANLNIIALGIMPAIWDHRRSRPDHVGWRNVESVEGSNAARGGFGW